ncbi:somatomedin-B and thrombospondin type-1 domain-containing protein-like [Hydractinia symbiolongicarpus]|uniref:somatomedin-B and thrombospondin type-1 domain-containing protein-like n=1 Tax=Hydractinia symbiolongicarpus TaxID=13093 RepID=UPI00254ADDA9|nr:somatomedin-B and thrombospondin type-1 domain-containing protein-like [Hydractinia symbiolongicarpus]
MFTWKFALSIIIFQVYITLCYGLCDQRETGGDLKCCKFKDASCFVKTYHTRARGLANSICYCDAYCKFTKDCCKDIDKVRKLCDKPVHCIVSEWEKWTGCSTKCGFGVRKRKRSIKQKNQNGGNPCGPLEQVRGCNMNSICDSNEDTSPAFILPITFRRPHIGKYIYENILPATRIDEAPKSIHKPTYSYCVHYKVTYRRRKCAGTWAGSLQSEMPVCTECQSRVMNGGHCRGEGRMGQRTRWKALGLSRCQGDWVRLGQIIPNCTCDAKQFSNFVFV